MLKKIAELLEKELNGNLIIFSPIFIAFGALIFFNLEFDPSYGSVFLPLFFMGIISAILYKRNSRTYFIISYFSFLIILGFSAADYRTESLKSPKITQDLSAVRIYGTVSQINLSQESKKIILSDLDIENLPLDKTPKFIRINTKSSLSAVKIGDRITTKAVIMPPPLPSYPDGFNFSEYAYFKQIGGIGYSVSGVKLVDIEDENFFHSLFEKARHSISSRLKEVMGEPEGDVAAALLVGFSAQINKDVYEHIRISGIAHIMAISGMHVVIVVGLVFLVIRLLLSKIPQLTLRYDLKKISAISALIISFIYLQLAGSPVSAERAFIMSAIVLLAIIFDRNANPLRSISIAAILILISTPEAIKSASLQMSFAACLALISSYNHLQFKFNIKGTKSKPRKVFLYFASIVLSTLIAGTATAPFVIYHFNQYSTYSILTNLVAIPLADFIVMPLGVLSLVLMPLKLDFIPLKLMGYSISFMLNYSKFISQLPYSSLYISKFTETGITLIAFGGVIITLMQTNLKYTGIPFILIGLFMQNNLHKPDILIDSQGKLFAVKGLDGHLYTSSKVKSRFVRSSWEEAYDEKNIMTFKDVALPECDDSFCLVERNNKKALIIFNSTLENYPDANLVIELSPLNHQNFNYEKIIGLGELEHYGTHAIWLSDEKNILIKTVKDQLKNRIWNK